MVSWPDKIDFSLLAIPVLSFGKVVFLTDFRISKVLSTVAFVAFLLKGIPKVRNEQRGRIGLKVCL